MLAGGSSSHTHQQDVETFFSVNEITDKKVGVLISAEPLIQSYQWKGPQQIGEAILVKIIMTCSIRTFWRFLPCAQVQAHFVQSRPKRRFTPIKN